MAIYVVVVVYNEIPCLKATQFSIVLGTTQNEPDTAPHFFLPQDDAVFEKMKKF